MHVNLMINSQFRKKKTSILIIIKVFFWCFILPMGWGNKIIQGGGYLESEYIDFNPKYWCI